MVMVCAWRVDVTMLNLFGISSTHPDYLDLIVQSSAGKGMISIDVDIEAPRLND